MDSLRMNESVKGYNEDDPDRLMEVRRMRYLLFLCACDLSQGKNNVDAIQHGIPRVSGQKATAGPDYEKELRKIEHYRALVDTVNAKMLGCEYTNEVLHLTTELLELNPEYYTIWNHRRRLLRAFFLEKFRSEDHDERRPDDASGSDAVRRYILDDLAFLLPLLRKFPKCYWIWNYRLWLLDEASLRLLPVSAYEIWQKELSLVGKMLTLDSRNFHGWGYRRKVVSTLEKLSKATNPSSGSMTEVEFNYTTKMIENNLSKEFELVQRALWADPDSKDQSLWFYHQYLISNFEPGPSKDSILPDLSVKAKLSYIRAQITDLQDMLEGAETCKWIYQRLLDLALMSKTLSGDWPIPSSDLESWIANLAELDPLRKGRWDDLRSQMDR
ncbi:MAG: hypothetical protein LQ344_002314 [Seirophora lacunosa]|nr:MAG: hypothetical protein LQ344_002314 [Seirophora lacunosa]